MEDTLNKIRDEAGSFRMQPRAGAWDRVRQKLDRKKGRIRHMRFTAWAVAASAVGLIALTALLLYQNSFRLPGADAAWRQVPVELEVINPADTDGVARMAVDFSDYLKRNYPEGMEMLHNEDAQF